MSERINPAALAVLDAATCEGHGVRLPNETLERDTYEEVAEILARIGGKWKRRGKAKDGVPQGTHEFPYDPAPLLAAVLETGEMPPKNPTAFFPTPAGLVAQMVEYAGLASKNGEGCRILEPSAGRGAIAEAIRVAAPDALLDTVEILPINAAMLRRKGFTPHEGDFLDWHPDYEYDAVLMNPPFSLEGDKLAYITHIRHAWSLLREGGELVAITPTAWGYRSDAKCAEFRTMVGEYGKASDVEAGAFKESGTGVATRIVWMRKDDQTWKANPFNGWPSWHCWAIGLWSDQEREFHDARERIWAGLRTGTLTLDVFGRASPPTRAAIVEHYRAIIAHANKHHEGIRPTEADLDHMVEHCIEEYKLEEEWEAEGAEPAVIQAAVMSAHPPVAQADLFTEDRAA